MKKISENAPLLRIRPGYRTIPVNRVARSFYENAGQAYLHHKIPTSIALVLIPVKSRREDA